MNKPIGIFDSGIGGLTVVKAVLKTLPEEQIVYFGDTARVPYGNKSTLTIRKFSYQIAQFLVSHDVKFIVVACNTVSATSLDWLTSHYLLPIIGVIEPAVEDAIKATKNNKIGVIGTRATIESNAYQNSILHKKPNAKVYSYPCPLLVPLAEEGWLDSPATKIILNDYLSPLKKKGIDTLILGCTHYPLLEKTIQKVMGEKVMLINSADSVAKKVKAILHKNKTAADAKIKAPNKFYFSDIPRQFSTLTKNFLGIKIKYIKTTL
jgi:glutamate racemase